MKNSWTAWLNSFWASLQRTGIHPAVFLAAAVLCIVLPRLFFLILLILIGIFFYRNLSSSRRDPRNRQGMGQGGKTRGSRGPGGGNGRGRRR